MQKQKLFIVSNRLPVTIEQNDHGHVTRPSSGGLVSAITGYLNREGRHAFSESIWCGDPGCTEKVWNSLTPDGSGGDYTFLPVFVNRKKYELYYNGFSNSLLWPLFHYFPSYVEYNSTSYQAYLEVNQQFADCLAARIRKGDIVWIHDYHLLPLAELLRRNMPGVTIGFFLHVPFPSYELFRLMPKQWQRTLLRGMMGADLIGFHTIDYASHFLSTVEEVLKVEHDGQYTAWDNRQIKADAFPISIDYGLFHDAYDDAGVSAMRQKYQAIKGDRKLIFSVDRLDYTKGVANRLNAFEQFIANYAEYSGKVIFVLVIVPSRHSITKYAERKRIIDEKVGYINSRLGNIGWQPVIYTYGHLSFQELVGLYTVCDLALITPLRDGMNLVCKEFVASRKDGQGVLVLSEMAGAASELTEALLINPNDVQEMASGIKAGLEMSREEQKERMAEMQDRIRHYDVYTWASSFFSELQAVKDLQLEFEFKFLDDTARRELLGRYAGGRKRIFLLDYDGTLVPFSKLPSMAAPGQELLGMLEQLGSNPLNDVFLVSGRDSQTLGKWFAGLPVGLIAEHGAKIRHKDGVWETETMVFSGEWMEKIGRIMEDYVNKCPHAFVERKEFSIAWHYRNADLAEGAIRARELYDDLVKHSAGLSLNILNGNKVIEARIKGIDKGAAVMRILERGEYDFILCIGDDETDEDMFKKLALRPEAYTIKVGNEASFAKYNLYNPSMVQGLLGMIAGGA